MSDAIFLEMGKTLIRRGAAIEKLGQAMTDKTTTLKALAALAHEAGLNITLELISDQQPQGGEDE